MGKGSKRRPTVVSDKQFEDNWEKAFGNNIDLDHEIKLADIAKNHEISGGSIMNILKYCVTKAAQSGKRLVTKEFLLEGIKNEMIKEGKPY